MVLIVAIVGVYYLFNSHAATPYVVAQAESGTLSNGAFTQSSSAANGGAYVQFSGAVTVTVPTSIKSDCSTDVTSALTFWLATLTANTTVNMPSKGCYLVSNSQNSLLTIEKTQGLTINGNGSTFKQASYDGYQGGACNDFHQPILTLGVNSNITINNFTLLGPHNCSGAGVEGDSGVYMYQNKGVALNSMTINGEDGDGLDIYPLNNDPGVNWDVTVNNSTLENIGYHSIVPEAVDGFTFENSTVTSGDIDAEVDYACTPPATPLSNCGTMSDPSIGMQNFMLKNNSFPNGLQLGDGEACMPVGNWAIENNNLGAGGMVLQFNTTYSLGLDELTGCGQTNGLTITGNTSTDTTLTPCCGSGSAYIVLQGWKNVNISNNNLVYDKGQGLAGDAVIDMWADSNVNIENNKFINLYNYPDTGNGPAGWPKNTNITSCGNVWGQLAGPIKEPACASP